MVRKVGRVLAALTLVMSAAACDDNPLAEDRDEAAYFRLNPSNVAVNAGGTVRVDAVVVNKYGAATNEAVTATPCDNKVTAVADTGRTAFEFPERFVVTGAALGTSCLVVRGGGITDTVEIRVIPARVQLVGLDTVPSGSSISGQLRFLDVNGNPVTGLSAADVTFTSTSETVAVVDATGNVTGRAPGSGSVITTLKSSWGATRVDTARFVVRAGPFAGTVVQGSYQGGQALTFTQGSIPFDADTEVRIQTPAGTPFSDVVPTASGLATGSTARAMLPLNLPAGTRVSYDIINLGANQVAVTGSFVTTSATPAVDTHGDATSDPSTAPTMTVGTDVFGTISGDKPEVLYKFVPTRTGAHTLTAHWDDGSDVDAYILSTSFAALLRRETLANPETGSVSLTAGTTYYVYLLMYEAATSGNSTYRISIK